MKLADLKGKGGFVSTELVKKEVQWEHGGETLEFTIHVRRLPFGEVERLYIDPTDKDRSRNASLIAACIVLGDGDEPMTYKDAFALETSLATVFLKAITETQNPKTSAPPKSSGTS